MATQQTKGRVLPMYFVADESWSMLDHVGVLNEGLRRLYDIMQTETLAAAKVRFTILGFSDKAIEHLSLAQLADIERDELPTLQARGGTSYREAFGDLLKRLPQDVTALKGDGYGVHRPAVFFLTDGQPNREDWQSVHKELTSPTLAECPNILAFGVGEANESNICAVATDPDWAFIAENGAETGTALATFMEQLTRSVVASGRAVAAGDAELQMEKPAGFKVAAPLI